MTQWWCCGVVVDDSGGLVPLWANCGYHCHCWCVMMRDTVAVLWWWPKYIHELENLV